MKRQISFLAQRGGDFALGSHLGTVATDGGLRYEETAGRRRYLDPWGDGTSHDYAWTSWLSPAVTPDHRFTSLVPSWNARTPDGSWLEIEARTTADGVHWSRWWVLGRWSETDEEIHSTTVADQEDDTAHVRIEELVARPGTSWSAYQLRLTLLRPAAGTALPSVSLVGAVVACGPAGEGPHEPGGTGHGTEVPVPPYSQQVHRGEYPQWDAGGRSWCSPTSTAMVLGTWGLGPTPEDYAWVKPDYRDRFVDHAARYVFDQAYGGAGNWSFNTAYAALHGTEAFVTRLSSLAEAEQFVTAGIPLVASVAFEEGELPGAGYRTSGHLLVVAGFDDQGDVIVNDPASHQVPSNAEVRVVYPRRELEQVWMRSGGIVYVIHPVDVPLPTPLTSTPRW
ncbi:MAG: C39 family peptidase [Nocardioides sp.]